MASSLSAAARNISEMSHSNASESSFTSALPRSDTIHLTPQTASRRSSSSEGRYPYRNEFDDPRSSSTQSLRPIESPGENRRTLLLIYIHGFLGDETSFKSFPAHVHNLLTLSLTDTHVVYTKIYPRYKSRKNISVARDDFSKWLAPHESPRTDVVLVGHSLGGILGAEVVLLQSYNPESSELYQHRILGQIAVDTPFLGMHPSVIKTGIASIFRSNPDSGEQPDRGHGVETPISPSSSLSDVLSPLEDPKYNPSYPNDIHLAIRKGKLERGMYFWNKHWGELRSATKNYVKSHLEFGGCLADYAGLRKRYNAIRLLEDVDEVSKPQTIGGKPVHRVRFVNYYSASTGRIKKSDTDGGNTSKVDRLRVAPPTGSSLSPRMEAGFNRDTASVSSEPTPLVSPRISIEEHDGLSTLGEESRSSSDLKPEAESTQALILDSIENINLHKGESAEIQPLDDLPPLPPLPEQPLPLDESQYSNQDALTIARKDHDRKVRAYERAKEDHEEMMKDREEIREKRQGRLLPKDTSATDSSQNQEAQWSQKEAERLAVSDPEANDKHAEDPTETMSSSVMTTKDRKFCVIPGKNAQTGMRDPTWIRIYMPGMDEVVAHTSMFTMSEAYATFVGDVTARIEEWVRDDATKRVLLEET